jgi:hypothetical protein
MQVAARKFVLVQRKQEAVFDGFVRHASLFFFAPVDPNHAVGFTERDHLGHPGE